MIREIDINMLKTSTPMRIARALTESYTTEMMKLNIRVTSVKAADHESGADITFKDPVYDSKAVDDFRKKDGKATVSEGKPGKDGMIQGVLPGMDDDPFKNDDPESAKEAKARECARIAIEAGSGADIAVQAMCMITHIPYKRAIHIFTEEYRGAFTKEVFSDYIEDMSGSTPETPETEEEEPAEEESDYTDDFEPESKPETENEEEPA